MTVNPSNSKPRGEKMAEGIRPSIDRLTAAKHKQQKLVPWGFGTAVLGLMVLCVGCFMMMDPTTVASKVLFANVPLGQPVTEIDALKVHGAVFGASMVLAYGLLSVAVGIVLVVRGRKAAAYADRG
jgi:hypothetical protein